MPSRASGSIDRPVAGSTSARRASKHCGVSFREELAVELADVDYLGGLENVFTYEGRPGHEIVLVHRIELPDEPRFSGDAVAGEESDGATYTARWLPLAEVRDRSAILYPTGLLDLLDGIRSFPASRSG